MKLRALFTILACSLFLNTANAQPTTGMMKQAVEQAKRDLESQHISLSGPCGAFRITNLVAYRYRSTYGLLVKKGGNRAVVGADGTCVSGEQSSAPGYATDYVIEYGSYYGWDLLGDGGGANDPQFSGPETADDMVARNRDNNAAAFDWGVVVPSPQPQPEPTPVPAPGVDLGPLTARVSALEAVVAQLVGFANGVAPAVQSLSQRIEALAGALAALDGRVQVLEARPIVTSCSAAANLGFARIPVSCKLQ